LQIINVFLISSKVSDKVHVCIQASKGLIDSKPGGFGQGTWVHPKVALKLAEWLSVDFELAVNDLVESFLRGTLTTEQRHAAAQSVVEAVRCEEQVFKRVKFGDDAEGMKLQRRHDHDLLLQINASSFNSLKLLAGNNPADQALVNTSRTNFLRKHLSLTITDDTTSSDAAASLHTRITVREVAVEVLKYTGRYTSDKFLSAVGIKVGLKWAEAGRASVKRINNGLVHYVGTNLASCQQTVITEPVSADVLEKARFKYSEVYLQSRAVHNTQTHDTWTYPEVLAHDVIVAVLERHKEG
jgi:KilA-N domain